MVNTSLIFFLFQCDTESEGERVKKYFFVVSCIYHGLMNLLVCSGNISFCACTALFLYCVLLSSKFIHILNE